MLKQISVSLKKIRINRRILAVIATAAIITGSLFGIFSVSAAVDAIGTFEDGITTGGYGKINQLEPMASLTNGDFSQGLKFWGTVDGSAASKYGKPLSEEGVTFLRYTPPKAYDAVCSRPFRIEGAKKGDKYALMANFRGNTSFQLIIDHINGSSQRATGSKILFSSSDKDSFNSLVVSSQNLVIGSLASSATEYNFVVKIAGWDAGKSTDITNVKIVKVLDDGSYAELDGTKIVIKDDNGDPFDPDSGTETDGITSGGNGSIVNYPATETFTNGNFAKGLKNWGTVDGSAASKYAKVTTGEDGKKFITFTTDKEYTGLCSRPFLIKDAKQGEKYAVMASYKGNVVNDFQLIIDGINQKGTTRATGAVTVFKSSEENGWNVAASSQKAVLGELMPADNPNNRFGENYAFVVKIVAIKKTSTAQFTDIKVVKVLEDGSYTELDGTKIVFYDENGDVYDPYAGTAKNGIETGSNGGIYSFPATEVLTNGDFSKGLKYWGTVDGSAASTYAALKNEDGKSYISFSTTKAFTALCSRPFIINGAAKGDHYALMVSYRGDAAPFQFAVDSLNTKNTTRALGSMTVYRSESAAGFSVAVSQQQMTLGELMPADNPNNRFGENFAFVAKIVATKDTSTAEFTDVKVVKVGDDGSYYDLDGKKIVFYDENGDIYDPYAGSFNNGITTGANWGIYNYPALDALANGDFSKGLKYWATVDGSSPSVYAKLVNQNGNYHIAFSTDKEYTGLCSRPFIIKNAKPGDKYAVMAEYRGDVTNFQFAFDSLNTKDTTRALGSTTIYKDTKKNGWNVAVSSQVMTLGTILPADNASNKFGTDYAFVAKIIGTKKGVSAEIGSLKVVRVLEDNSFTELDGKKIVFYDENGEVYDPYSGTYDEGIVTGKNFGIYNYPAAEEFKNGDFSKGFKYWGTRTGVPPTEYAAIKNENGKNYITMKSGDFLGINSRPFKIKDAKEGAKYAVIVKYRGDNAFQLAISTMNCIDSKNGGGFNVLYEAADENGWNIAVSSTPLTVNSVDMKPDSVKKWGTDPVFMAILQPTGPDVTIDLCDVAIVRVVNDNEYYNLDGSKYVVPESVSADGKPKGFPEMPESKFDIKKMSNNKQADVKSSSLSVTMIVIIVLGAVVAAAAVGTVVMIVVRKKSASGLNIKER